MYKHGSGCKYEANCKKGNCRSCIFYDGDSLYGVCRNKDSENYEQEVYPKACCEFICNKSN